MMMVVRIESEFWHVERRRGRLRGEETTIL